MALTAYLTIGTIGSTVIDEGIELLSFEWSIGDPATGAGSSPIIITKQWDTFSSKLFTACTTGERFQTATLSVLLPTTTASYLRYTFSNAIISSMQTAGNFGGADVPTETLAIAYTAVTMISPPAGSTG